MHSAAKTCPRFAGVCCCLTTLVHVVLSHCFEGRVSGSSVTSDCGLGVPGFILPSHKDGLLGCYPVCVINLL